ncbi:carbohydrate ABC transporter substrate-binding protein [Paenibacillus sp. OV219]|uniref:carbohydrate ABC transporter substrate-binding protein n=1 Tax=Paenibacillus sp. OV219 TaxID=1884377 RepID=UPI0008B6D58D|nr:carbohydrate ABC transporter substrate-binding protein [Paenibacillus sp. OV219]SEO89941.1 carbohydrate ABC transporter substrate-binding protein, CUT1 family [Paenibacillus sp. OV219]
MSITRWIAIGLSMAIIGALLCSCSLSESKAKLDDASGSPGEYTFANKTLSVAVFDNGSGSKEKYWRAIIQKFEADYPGVTIHLQSNPNILDIIAPQFITGHPPDLIVIPPNSNGGVLDQMTKDKQFLDLTPLFESNGTGTNSPLKDSFLDGILTYSRPLNDGKMYFAPFTTSPMGLIYNKALFRSKGWKPPKTWDEFMALGKAAKQEGRSLFTYQGLYPSYIESMFWSSVASAGAPEAVMNAENYVKGAFKSSSVQQAMEVYATIAKKGYLLPGSVTMNHTQSQAAFLQGKALFIPCGTWIEDEMKNMPREDGFEYGFLAPPVFTKDAQQYAEIWMDGIYIPAKAQNIELAKAFLSYQYRDESVKLNAEITQGVVAVKNGADLAKPYISPVFYDAAKIFDNGVKPIIFQWKSTPSTDVNITNDLWLPLGSIMQSMMSVSQWQDQLEAASAKLRALLASVTAN